MLGLQLFPLLEANECPEAKHVHEVLVRRKASVDFQKKKKNLLEDSYHIFCSNTTFGPNIRPYANALRHI
jgi:hypothetical protein